MDRHSEVLGRKKCGCALLAGVLCRHDPQDDNLPLFFDTVKDPAQDIPRLEAKARTQNERVLDFLTSVHPSSVTAEVVMVRCGITEKGSVSRALTTLTDRGKAEKVGAFGTSSYGVSVNRWKARV